MRRKSHSVIRFLKNACLASEITMKGIEHALKAMKKETGLEQNSL